MDPSKINDLQDLQSLLDLMGRYGLSELELQSEGRKIRLKKPDPPTAVMQAMPFAAGSYPGGGLASPGGLAVPAAALPSAPAMGGSPAGGLAANLKDVTSPMVGTFYRAPSPEADPFVREGDRVEEKTILCLIEAMKVMNEIPGGIAGVVKEVLVKNGESVEFGQPLFRIQVE